MPLALLIVKPAFCETRMREGCLDLFRGRHQCRYAVYMHRLHLEFWIGLRGKVVMLSFSEIVLARSCDRNTGSLRTL